MASSSMAKRAAQLLPFDEERCPRAKRYAPLGRIGEGAYGEVQMCVVRDKGEAGGMFALKKLVLKEGASRDGFPPTALREIKLLKECKHENIVRLHEIVINKKALEDPAKDTFCYMVFEYMEHDLGGLLEAGRGFARPLELADVKCIARQLLLGLHYLHTNCIMHRDIKPANLLLSAAGVLKLADFGMARRFAPDVNGRYTKNVCTRWYCAPEMLLGSNRYTAAIDVWSAACVMAELLLPEPLFKSKSEAEHVEKLFNLVGVTGTSSGQLQRLTAMPKRTRPRMLTDHCTRKYDKKGVEKGEDTISAEEKARGRERTRAQSRTRDDRGVMEENGREGEIVA